MAATLGLVAACAGGGISSPPPAAQPASSPSGRALRVMTFNIRYGTAPDGDDAWPRRRHLAIGVIRSQAPTVLGLQEAVRFQLDQIIEALPHYGEVGVGRDDGGRSGEYAALLYDRRRLTVSEWGTFWLSDAPDIPGSMTWGNRFPRVVTWARFRDATAKATLYAFNSHWDHESAPSRERSAALMLERISARAFPDEPVLLTGDFNADEHDPPFRTLTTPRRRGDRTIQFADSFRIVHPAAGEVSSYHGFTGNPRGAKLDAILVSPEWRVLDAEIVRFHAGGRYPSDHFPVTAVVSLD